MSLRPGDRLEAAKKEVVRLSGLTTKEYKSSRHGPNRLRSKAREMIEAAQAEEEKEADEFLQEMGSRSHEVPIQKEAVSVEKEKGVERRAMLDEKELQSEEHSERTARKKKIPISIRRQTVQSMGLSSGGQARRRTETR
ncbi:uncharacterized protein PV09_03223 [Verruconis gallopava]|uniref:Uncharacterized protein n=1 Tax=Verruconis gallopava TaxID=253628 RepID=A0A0D1YZE2_9PEZI|nr:uncharacterized protein PV09_03223 [Verruconis gallopava]KIW06047.1 hypothetical protein PV09_03223 [Verruconis gallopava]